MTESAQRRQRIAEILSRNHVVTQEQLQALLEAEGIATTQSSVSRDLRELGFRKSATGYVSGSGIGNGASLSAGGKPTRSRRQFIASLHGLIVSAERGGTMVVLATRSGQAPVVAAAIQRSGLTEVLGAIAGGDTVFVATQTAAQARSLHRALREAIAKPE